MDLESIFPKRIKKSDFKEWDVSQIEETTYCCIDLMDKRGIYEPVQDQKKEADKVYTLRRVIDIDNEH